MALISVDPLKCLVCGGDDDRICRCILEEEDEQILIGNYLESKRKEIGTPITKIKTIFDKVKI